MPHTIMDTCIGCTICAQNCPVDAISGSLKEQHKINPKRCIDCSVCGKSCPSSAVVDSIGKKVDKQQRASWKTPHIDLGACSACAMCVDICKFDCLKITYPKYKSDISVYAELQNSKACIDCGLCAKICPLHAITMKEAAKDA